MNIEAMKQALEALEKADKINGYANNKKAITALRQAIEQAEKQEPVGYWNGKETAWFEHETDRPVGDCTIPLYASPSKREWVGLTDEEIKEIIGPWGPTPIKGYTRKLFDAIEAKLKEKNT